MACVVLPSETARLIYGYLLKEKLDNIALQFLEHSPYLTDCYDIVKSGYQFNTKFLYKELHELIQEYSTIQNLVNKKVGLLSKTSPLYKRIKLHCENLSEIVDSFLFWSHESKGESNSPNTNKTIIVANQREKKADKTKEITADCALTGSLQISNCSEYNMGKDTLRGESEAGVFEDSDSRLGVNFSLNKSDSCQSQISMNCMMEKNEKCSGSDMNSGNNTDVTKKNCENQASQDSSHSETSKDNTGVNITVDQSCTNDTSKVDIPLLSSGAEVTMEDHMKIVRMEKDNQLNEEKNQLQNSFVKNLGGMESNMSVENSSVLYVTPDMGNVLNQDRNQIIVIPIDYYKGQNEMGSGQSQNQNLNGNISSAGTGNNGIIFEDVSGSNILSNNTSSNSLSFSNSVEKKCTIDENIVTEGTFLKNKEIIYELESKIKPQIFQEAAPLHQIVPASTSAPNSLPTFYLTPVIEKPKREYRRILPKRDPSVQSTPIVVMQRLPKSRIRAARARVKVGKSPKKKETKKKAINTKVKSKKVQEVLNMPSIRTPASEKYGNLSESASIPTESETKSREAENSDVNEKISEEKENVEANEKKIETPAVIMNKNTKRLSLSTPRRKSHIRALEFETPPKVSSVKKSKTSPKVKVDEVKVKNRNVRNTLFKSPDSEIVFKSPSCLNPEKKSSPKMNNSLASDKFASPDAALTTPSPIQGARTEEEWESVPGRMNCGQSKAEEALVTKKSWDADLRDFIPPSCYTTPSKADLSKKKRARKSKRTSSKDEKSPPMSNSKKETPLKKFTASHVITSPSKISLTAKRNTFSISGNDERSPVCSLLEELDLVTPFKDTEPARSVEETPLTKLFRENVNGLDIDLNMINTPIFPPTPSIIITPDVEDSLSLASAYYYTPHKDNSRERLGKLDRGESQKNDTAKADEYISESTVRRGSKEKHEKVIDELVSKAKEIVGIRSGENEDSAGKKPPSGKVLSMVKIQMITQCDKKLCENIPINEDSIGDVNNERENTLIEKIAEEAAKFDLKCELEEKRLRALRKIKTVKENLTPQTKKKVKKSSPIKRKRIGETGKLGKKFKKEMPCNSSMGDDVKNESGEAKQVEIVYSTPKPDRGIRPINFDQEEPPDRVDKSVLEEIRGEFPPFEDDGQMSELPVKTRKKLHYIKHFLKTQEIANFLENNDVNKLTKLKLKKSHRKFFQVFHKWLKHPHAREVNTSERTKKLFKEYRILFDRIKSAATTAKIIQDNLNDTRKDEEDQLPNFSSSNPMSDDDNEIKQRKLSKKEDDTDDGPVSILPLKKRKATVQPLQANSCETEPSQTEKEKTGDNSNRTQTFLQDIDVDRFLSQIHGQENR